MSNKDIAILIAALLAASNLDAFAEMARWRIGETKSVRALCDGADPLALNTLIDNVVAEGLGKGWLERSGHGTKTELIIKDCYVTEGRRTLYRMNPSDAKSVYQDGRMLAKRLATSSKKWLSSDGDEYVRSANPGSRRHLFVGM